MLAKDTRDAVREAFLEGELRVRSVLADGSVSLCVVSDVLQHQTKHKQALQVNLASGVTVTATQDHSLFTLTEEGTISPLRTDAIQVGTPIVVVQEDSVTSLPVQSVTSVAPLTVSYDLSVPGPENFVLANGVLAHNSYSIGGVSLDLDKSSKYESAAQMAADQFDKQLERAKLTVKIVKGLQQAKYGTGVRSAFGPYSSNSQLTPAKFMGF